MEEIDIIELLQRVKEGKAPKRIQINNTIYNYMLGDGYLDDIETMYENNNGDAWLRSQIVMWFDTKIKILDKPIIERLEVVDLTNIENTIINIGQKLNEIIDYINQNNKE